MPTFKNIRVPVGKTGKTRLQRVQVLKSGKFKFVKNIKKGKSSSSRSSTSSRKKSTRSAKRSVRKTGSKMLRTVGAIGAAEDIAWGFVGFSMLGGTPASLPMTRVIQGVAGHALDRRGKRRLVDGILDLVALWLAGGLGRNGVSKGAIINPLRQLQKITFL